MRMSSKFFEGVTGAVLVAATALTVGAAFDAGSGKGESSVARAPSSNEVESRDMAWAAGDAVLARCELLPRHYRVREAQVPSGSFAERDTAWAAGDAAVARYLNELARQCPVPLRGS
jgi:hypothetical protein